MSRDPAQSSPTPAGIRLAAVVGGAVSAVWLAVFLWPRGAHFVGIADYGAPFLDSYALMAALDAVRAGADPHAPNVLDPLMRGHVYSDWWLALRWLGLSRENNWAVGLSLAALFGLVAWATTRPRGWAEAGWLGIVLVSPPLLLALTRANNDLVIFIILAGVGLLAGERSWHKIMAVGCLGLATGLKYFPAPAALALLWYRPARGMPTWLLAGLLATCTALAGVWDQIERARFVVGSGIYTFGAPLLWRDFGWSDAASALPSVAILGVGGAILAAFRLTTGLTRAGSATERLRAAVGAIVLLTCFVSGMNYAYRWLFVVWPALWLWRRAIEPAGNLRLRRTARVGAALLGFALWSDGLLCMAVNLSGATYSPVELYNLEATWRLWTQPVVWLLMIALAGWVIEGALESVQAWWAARHET